jgi:hypothetical protein
MILSSKQVEELAERPWLNDFEVIDIMDTLLFYFDVNERQGDMLGQAIDEVVSLRERVKFYRDSIIKIV